MMKSFLELEMFMTMADGTEVEETLMFTKEEADELNRAEILDTMTDAFVSGERWVYQLEKSAFGYDFADVRQVQMNFVNPMEAADADE